MLVPYQIAVVASGRGSNLKALLHALEGEAIAQVAVVIGHSASVGALGIARSHLVPTVVIAEANDTRAWLATLEAFKVDLVVLAGYLKLVPPAVVEAYRGRIINIHPALLPKYGGRGMYGDRVHRAVLDAGETISGATVHLVSEEYDKGSTLAQATVPVRGDDTPESLAEKVLGVEHRLLPQAVLRAAQAGRPVPFDFVENGS